jgi:tetratricopeptide (TPR) repeat protein
MNRRTLLVAGIALLLAGGVAAALMLRNRRDFTTSSNAAYQEYVQGVDATERFYFREARAHFAAALKKDPHFVMAMLQLANLSADRDQRRALVEAASRFADRLTPREELFLKLQRAMLVNDKNAIRAAAEQLKQKYPKDATGYMALANQAVLAGRPDDAIQLYKDLVAKAPNNAPAYNQLGYMYAYRGDFPEAIANLRRYAFLAPDQPNPFDSLGEIETYFGHYDDAIRDLNKALALRPDFYQSYGNLAECYRQKGDLTRAREYAEKALAMNDNPGERNGYVEQILLIDLDRGDLADARRVVEAMPQKGAPFADVLHGLFESVIEARQGRLDAALQQLDALEKQALAEAAEYKAGKTDVENVIALIRGGILYRAGRFGAAVAPLEKFAATTWTSLAARQRVMRARAWLAVCLAHQGDFSRADQLLAQNRSWNQNDAETREASDRIASLRHAALSAAR